MLTEVFTGLMRSHYVSRQKDASSGVASGWHGWTMSRGPGAKGAPRDREKKEKRKIKKRKGRGRGPGEPVVHGPRTSSLRHWMLAELTSLYPQNANHGRKSRKGMTGIHRSHILVIFLFFLQLWSNLMSFTPTHTSPPPHPTKDIRSWSSCYNIFYNLSSSCWFRN